MPTFECPICRQKITCAAWTDAPYRPFCSERCKLIDLGRWLNEQYRISEELPEPETSDTKDNSNSDAEPPGR